MSNQAIPRMNLEVKIQKKLYERKASNFREAKSKDKYLELLQQRNISTTTM